MHFSDLITEKQFHSGVQVYLTVTLGMTIPFLMKNPAGYGRHENERTRKALEKLSRGITLPPKLAWTLMELPAFLICIICYLNRTYTSIPSTVFACMYGWHYFYRSLIYPQTLRSDKPMPLHIMLCGAAVTSSVAYVVNREVTHFREYPESWVEKPNFAAGILLFALGWIANVHCDYILRNLRKPGETGYKIPFGGMYNFVTGANYFGEFMEWVGLAVASEAVPAWIFVLVTFANLFPRAVQHHKWYQEKFEDYPKSRKAFFPYIY